MFNTLCCRYLVHLALVINVLQHNTIGALLQNPTKVVLQNAGDILLQNVTTLLLNVKPIAEYVEFATEGDSYYKMQ